jgi:hypothetical protein
MHRALQNDLTDLLESAGLVPLPPEPDDPEYDLAWFTGDSDVSVVEVKSLTLANEIRQLRAGLGQILDYADNLRRRGLIPNAILYLPRRPTEVRWIEIARDCGVVIGWPDTVGTILHNQLQADES